MHRIPSIGAVLVGLCMLAVVFAASRTVPHASSPAIAPPPASPVMSPVWGEALYPERSEKGMVVAARREAAEAGVEMLKKGGNAVDAAVATGFALAVVYPLAGNIGGGGFMVLRQPDGSITTLDHREEAPQAATRTMYQDEQGEAQQMKSRVGHLASGVPGTVAGLLDALERYGTLSRAEVMAPAIRLAREGFQLSNLQADNFNQHYEEFAQFEGTQKYFTKGHPDSTYRTGETFVQSDLADVLERIRDDGRDGFYTGETARLIAEEMARGDGLISEEDLAAYQPIEREPIRTTYRGYQVYSMGPPSSGGVALAQLFNAAEMRDLTAMGFHSSAMVHYLGEAMRRVYADRAKYLGDTDFVEVPIDSLTSKSYMRRRMASYDSLQITPSDSVGYEEFAVVEESQETTHYSVVDKDGMAVSLTTTINSAYGSKVVVDGAGFFMNNEMDDFSIKPGVPNQFGLVGSEANAIAPGKRMLSSMSPTIVEDPQGRLMMVIGSPGGSTIITTVFQSVLNMIDYDMNIEQAVTARRFHHQWLPEAMWHERYGLPLDVQRNLKDRGWPLEAQDAWGRANGISVAYGEAPGVERVYYGASDPRRIGAAVGY